MSITTYPLDGKYYNAQDAETYLCTRTSGVFSEDISFTPNGMNITVSPFLAWIKNDDFSGKSVAVTTDTTLTISPSEPILSRIDRIVLRFDARKNGSELMVLKGTPSSSPAVPSISRTPVIYDLCLCQISVKPSATSISAGDITSTLLDESLCGIMRDGVTGIPTLQLQSQAQALIRELEVAISMAENGSPVLQSLGIKRGTVDVTIGTEGQKMYTSGAVPFDVTFLDTPTVVVSRRIHGLNEYVYKQIKPQESVAVGAGHFTLNVFSETDISATQTLRYNWIAIGKVAWDNDSGGGGGDGGGGDDGGGGEDDTEYFTISTSVDPAGWGITEGAGNFAKNSKTTLVARAFSGYSFDGWYLGNSKITSNAEHTVTVTSNATYTAKFVEAIPDIVVQINVDPVGAGGVSGAGTYKKGSVVSLAASPKDGYNFVGWFVGDTQYSDSTNYSVKLNGSTTFTAKFEEQVVTPDYYTVIAKVTPTGSGTVTGGGQYVPGATARLTASANEEYVFSHWTSGTETINTAEFTFVVSSDRTWTAHFIEGEEETGKVTITTSVEPANSGTVTGGGEVTSGSMSAVQANANDGYKFKHWRFEDGTTNTENPYLFRASADRTFVAVFEVDSGEGETTYTEDTWVGTVLYVGTEETKIETDNSYSLDYGLTEVIIPEGRTKIATYVFGSCSALTKVTIPSTMTFIGTGAFDECSSLTEITYNGTKSQWNNISKPASFDGDLDDITIHCTDGDINYVKMTISVSLEGSGSVTTSPTAVTATTGDTFYVKNSTVDLTATPSSGYKFKFWVDDMDDEIPANPLSVGVYRDYFLTAIFEVDSGEEETTYTSDTLIDGTLYAGTQTTNIETDSGYAGRTDITQVVIPEGRTMIADNCFSNCSNLTSVTIPVSLTQIGSYAFDYVDKLTDIYYGGTKAQWNTIGITGVFQTLYNLTVHCSDGNVEYCEVDFVFSPDEGTKTFDPHTQIDTTFGTSGYVKNSTVTLKAGPEDGYSFVRYERSDGVSSTSNPYSFTITRNMTVTVVTERTTTTETAKLYIYSSNAGTGDVVKLTKDEAGTQPWNKNEFSEGETAYFFAQAGTGRIIERLVFKIDNVTVADMTADEMVEQGILNSDKNKLSQQHYVSEGQTSEFVATVYFAEAAEKKTITFFMSYGTTKVVRNGVELSNSKDDFTYEFDIGDEVTLTFTPDSGYQFSSWINDDTMATLSSNNPWTFTVNSSTATGIGIMYNET